MTQIIKETETTLTIIEQGREDSYFSTFTAKGDNHTGMVFINGNANSQNREVKALFSDLRITDSSSGLNDYTPVSVKDALEKLSAFVGNFKRSGGSENTLSYDENGNIPLKEGAKILGTNENNEQYNLLELGEYEVEGETYDQTEVGSEHLHLNLNTIDNVTVETPEGKKEVALQEKKTWKPTITGLTEGIDYEYYAGEPIVVKVGSVVSGSIALKMISTPINSDQFILRNLPYKLPIVGIPPYQYGRQGCIVEIEGVTYYSGYTRTFGLFGTEGDDAIVIYWAGKDGIALSRMLCNQLKVGDIVFVTFTYLV